MTTKTIHARFKGKHLSMGFRRGCVYKLRVKEIGFFAKWIVYKGKVEVVAWREDKGYVISQCPYSSMATFLENWSILDKESRYTFKK